MMDQEVSTQKLLVRLSDMDMKSVCGNTEELSFPEILQRMSEVKAQAASVKRARDPASTEYVPPGGWKSERKALRVTKSLPAFPRLPNHTVEQFRPPPPKWDGSFYLHRDLYHTLWRTPDMDVSGKKFRSLPRDTKAPEGAPDWAPNSHKIPSFPPASPTKCNLEYQKLLLLDSEKTVVDLEEQYRSLPMKTESQRRIKAQAGADLFEMQQTREKIVGMMVTSSSSKKLLDSIKTTTDATAAATTSSPHHNRTM